MNLTEEQTRIVTFSDELLSVRACAGSGKTETAVKRLKSIRENFTDPKAYAVLLSFTNIAVETFKNRYGLQSSNEKIIINTLDGFITKHILSAHGSLVMKTIHSPFLITGYEGFLKEEKYKFYVKGKTYPLRGTEVGKISFEIENDICRFYFNENSKRYELSNDQVIRKLAQEGAYTHRLRDYWSYQVLYQFSNILNAFSKRYSHIIIDEAQDITLTHYALLKLWLSSGVKLSIFGDKQQAIYEFANARGEFIDYFESKADVRTLTMKKNFRATKDIINVINNIYKDDMKPWRENHNCYGAFWFSYDTENISHTLNEIKGILNRFNISSDKSAILCRAREMVYKYKKVSARKSFKKDLTSLFALAAIERDASYKYKEIFESVSKSIFSLIVNIPKNAYNMTLNISVHSEFRYLRRLIWFFIRDNVNGLPAADQNCFVWHEKLKCNLNSLLDKVVEYYPQFRKPNSIPRRVSKKNLWDGHLINTNVSPDFSESIRIDTVHAAKGESIKSVFYMGEKKNIDAMLDKASLEEEGRIGYVALTRATDLFVLGVPSNIAGKYRPILLKFGLKELKDDTEIVRD